MPLRPGPRVVTTAAATCWSTCPGGRRTPFRHWRTLGWSGWAAFFVTARREQRVRPAARGGVAGGHPAGSGGADLSQRSGAVEPCRRRGPVGVHRPGRSGAGVEVVGCGVRRARVHPTMCPRRRGTLQRAVTCPGRRHGRTEQQRGDLPPWITAHVPAGCTGCCATAPYRSPAPGRPCTRKGTAGPAASGPRVERAPPAAVASALAG